MAVPDGDNGSKRFPKKLIFEKAAMKDAQKEANGGLMCVAAMLPGLSAGGIAVIFSKSGIRRG